MKKIFYFLCITYVLLQSCTTGVGVNNSSSSNSIVGKWECYQVGSFPLGTVINGSESLYDFRFACPSYKDYLQFGSQGTLKVASFDSTCTDHGGIGTYTKSDNIINIYQNNVFQVSWEIIDLNNTTLKIKYPNPNNIGNSGEIIVGSFKKVP